MASSLWVAYIENEWRAKNIFDYKTMSQRILGYNLSVYSITVDKLPKFLLTFFHKIIFLLVYILVYKYSYFFSQMIN